MVADQDYDGDREKALNALIAWAATLLTEPDDPWKALTNLNSSRP